MTSAFSPWRPRRQIASGWLTSSVLFIGLLAAVPGADADTIPDWNLVTANALQTAQGWHRPGSQPGLCDGARGDV